jgi:2,3-bisphosphoglycerate-dependent phosphoglycerate mutase
MSAGRLILVRHGQSIWNLQNRFTGWIDVSLSQHGVQEAQDAATLLIDQRFDIAFVSSLIRAQDTLYEILRQNKHCHQYVRIHQAGRDWYEHFVPTGSDKSELKIYVSEKLNERYYGDLQGVNKDKAYEQFGSEQVHLWRRSWDVPPPNGESLAMTAERAVPYFQKEIVPHIKQGRYVLVSAHGNSLRALIKHIEQMTPAQIVRYELKTGSPHRYDFDDQLNITDKSILQIHSEGKDKNNDKS